jgi:hypothetical protein
MTQYELPDLPSDDLEYLVVAVLVRKDDNWTEDKVEPIAADAADAARRAVRQRIEVAA